ncbi:MAG: OmpA family protein [Myxococcales bacterium]|nr:OmpA family protein [Myxococcales bacterium]
MRRVSRVRGVAVDHEIFTLADGASPEHRRVLGAREACGCVDAWLDDPHSFLVLSRLFHARRGAFSHGLEAPQRREALATFLREQIDHGALRVAELHPPPPLPPNPGAKAAKAAAEESAPVAEALGWFEVTVVDAWGKPVDGVELEFSYQGTRKKLTTPGSGKARLPDVPSSFGSARIVNVKAVRDTLRPRWKDALQPTDLPPDLENPEKLGLDAADLVTSLESQSPKTLVLVKPLTRIRLVGMHFDTNKCFLKPSAMPGIKQVVSVYQRNPTGKLLVLGHTDTTADDAYNLDLSVERAEAVKAYLEDDVAAWEAWFGEGKPSQKRWGQRETSQMIAALPCEQSVAGFQAWSNDTRGTALEVDGIAGPKTRKALIEAYMALDGTTLPAAIEAVVHGCGEFFPRTDEGDQFGADGVAAAENRRVEMYCFDEEIAPPVPGKKATKGEPEVEQWKKQVTRTIDFGSEGDEEVGKIWMELWDKSGQKTLAGAKYTITGERDYEGTTDGTGRLLHDLVPHGDYRIRVDGCDEDSAALVLPKADDEPQIRFLV